MKKLITAIIVIISSTLLAQDNTMPATGKVGIGTLTPSARLDVNGNAIIDSCLLIKDSLTVNNNIRTMGRMFVEQKMTVKGNALVKQNIRVNGNSRIDGNQRVFGNSRVDGLLKLPNTGNLSNGNVNSGNFELLVVNANGTAKKISYDDILSKIGGGIYNPAPPTKCDIGVISSPRWANGPNKLFPTCPQVDVGIGTDTPLHKLHVNGASYFTGTVGIGVEPNINSMIFTKSTKEIGHCIDHTSSTPFGYSFNAIVHDEQTKGFGLYSTVYNKDVFTVYSNGKIELSNSTQKIFQIEPNGLIRGRQIKLDLSSWADYVFNDNYALMPLEDVEKFIQKEKHLPNVPSEAELIETGLDLEEMNTILMEKVEELTLYLIEQNKQVKELKERVLEL